MLSLFTAFLPAVMLAVTTVHGQDSAQGLLQSNAKWASNMNASNPNFFATSAQGQDPKVGHRVLQHVNSSLKYLYRFYGLDVLIHACQSRSLQGRFQELCSSIGTLQSMSRSFILQVIILHDRPENSQVPPKDANSMSVLEYSVGFLSVEHGKPIIWSNEGIKLTSNSSHRCWPHQVRRGCGIPCSSQSRFRSDAYNPRASC